MSWLWTSHDMVRIMGGRPNGRLPAGITGISLHSRAVAEGEAFFAVRGARIDGHDVARIAVANGASLIVVSEAKLPLVRHLSVPMIVVNDVLDALEKLAVASRQRSRAFIIAITGSVGKTTTKEMLRHALSTSGEVHTSVGSFNDHFGVPLTLARMPANCRFAVFEIGLIHKGDIRPLVKMVAPHLAVITKIAEAHLENFRNLDHVAVAKAEIFEGVQPGGAALLNRDDEQYDLLQAAAHTSADLTVHTFGQHTDADAKLLEFEGDEHGSVLQATLFGKNVSVQIEAPGRHIADNAMAVLGVCMLAGCDPSAALDSLRTFRPLEGRGLRHKLIMGDGHLTLIDESYNASPASMRAAIALLSAIKTERNGRQIAVLGDMLEMGKFSRAMHEQLAYPIVAAGIKHVWLAGREMAALRDALPDDVTVEYRSSTAALSDLVLRSVNPGDVVMVKSSRGMEFRKIVARLIERCSQRR